jgi:hypothetical protein
MQYLGALRGAGILTGGEASLGRVDYELDAYLVRPGEVVASGEIRMDAEQLAEAFGRRGLGLQTDDGRTLDLRFSGKRLSLGSKVAHVDIYGGLPGANEWRR